MSRLESTAGRERLPDRRPNDTRALRYAGRDYTLTIGYDPVTGESREVFADGELYGSDMAHIMSDACTVVSIALQRGATPDELAHSMGTVPDYTTGKERQAPASVIGAIIFALTNRNG